MGTDHRLTTRQMAEFVANGFIRFDSIVPDDINERAIAEMQQLEAERLAPGGMKPPHTGTLLDDCYPPPSVIGEYLRLPQIRGIIESFVGPNPRFDHDWTHHIAPHATYVQPFWYPHDVAPGEGGTRFVPGSHLRRVRSSGLDRYQHINGEQQFSGSAGTVVVFHHGLWHAGQPNPGDGHRWMHKVRLNPTVAQVRLWNTTDLPDLQNPPSDHIFARILPDSVAQIFRTWHPWMSVTDYRNEQVQRSRLWRYLTSDNTYDVDHYLTRLEGRSTLVSQ